MIIRGLNIPRGTAGIAAVIARAACLVGYSVGALRRLHGKYALVGVDWVL